MFRGLVRNGEFWPSANSSFGVVGDMVISVPSANSRFELLYRRKNGSCDISSSLDAAISPWPRGWVGLCVVDVAVVVAIFGTNGAE
jgi:hypothetical protein